jgi:hypothetical protein
MVDWTPLVNEPFHPVENRFSLDGKRYISIRPRGESPLVYYFIDFGLSVRFRSEEERKLITGQNGREQTVPELSEEEPYDPFGVDVFILGSFLERDIAQVRARPNFLDRG